MGLGFVSKKLPDCILVQENYNSFSYCLLTDIYGGDDSQTAWRRPGHQDIQKEKYRAYTRAFHREIPQW